MPPPTLTQWSPVRLAVPPPFLRADGADAMSSLARLVASGEVSSRTDLAKRTGLARSTIGTHLDRLQASGLIRDTGAAEPSGRGRPAQRLELAPESGFVLVADLGVHGARLAVADLGQRLVAQETLPVQLASGPEEILSLVEQRWRHLLSESGCSPTRVRTVTIGLPGPVDHSMGTPVRPPLMPGWDGYPVGQLLGERFGCHALVNNDANLMALGEARALPATQYPLVFIKISTGIGCGIISASGELHYGADGAAGDIGHIRVPDSDHVACRCGNVGCLEAVASAAAMVRALHDPTADLSVPPGDFTDQELHSLVAQIRQGDSQTIRLLRESSAVLGRLVASLVNVINPARIVLGGAIAQPATTCLPGFAAASTTGQCRWPPATSRSRTACWDRSPVSSVVLSSRSNTCSPRRGSNRVEEGAFCSRIDSDVKRRPAAVSRGAVAGGDEPASSGVRRVRPWLTVIVDCHSRAGGRGPGKVASDSCL